MFTIPASVAMALLQLIGFSEGAAGRFVVSWIFRPLVIALALLAGYLAVTVGVPAAIRAHDAQIASRAAETLRLRMEAAEAEARARAAQEAQERALQTLKAREGDIAALNGVVQAMTKEKDDARARSPDPDLIVVPAGDPWLR